MDTTRYNDQKDNVLESRGLVGTRGYNRQDIEKVCWDLEVINSP